MKKLLAVLALVSLACLMGATALAGPGDVHDPIIRSAGTR